MKVNVTLTLVIVLATILACSDLPLNGPSLRSGLEVVYFTDASLYVHSVRPSTGEQSTLTPLTGRGVDIAFLPDKNSVLYVDHLINGTATVCLYSFETRQQSILFSQPNVALRDFQYSARTQQIVFVEFNSQQPISQICIANLDGSSKRYLTTSETFKWNSQLSPDGLRVLFQQGSNDDADIWSVNVDGSNIKRLTTTNGFDGYSSFSPNGSQIVFSSTRNRRWNIFLMNSDGSNQHPLTQSDSLVYRTQPSWSPDGSEIAYIQNGNVFVIHADGINHHQVSFEARATHFNPRWTPDGKQLIYYSNSHGLNLFVVNRDGSNQQQITFLTPDQSGGNMTFEIASLNY